MLRCGIGICMYVDNSRRTICAIVLCMLGLLSLLLLFYFRVLAIPSTTNFNTTTHYKYDTHNVTINSMFTSLNQIREQAVVNIDTHANIHQSYDFVFGWSTGHVGTTTLSNARTYGRPEHVRFIHEGKKFHTHMWKESSRIAEYEFVRNIFIPEMLKIRGNSTTLLDLGHHNMYFIYGLMGYIESNKDRLKVLFVRIRRQRYEAATSLLYGNRNTTFKFICKGLVTRYCPTDRVQDILLVPPEKVWNTLSLFQKALWMVDEAEARWQYLVELYPSTHRIEVYWGKTINGSIEAAAKKIATYLHVNLSTIEFPLRQSRTHGAHASADAATLSRSALEDEQYKGLMNGTIAPNNDV